MPRSALQICNSAIIKLGGSVLSTLDDDTTEGSLVRAQYPVNRDVMLRSHTWVFAKAPPLTLTGEEQEDVSEWTYRFALPPDCGRILEVSVDGTPVTYELVGRLFYSDHSSVTLRYVQSYSEMDDAVEFPDDFAEALAYRLACDICMSLTQNANLRAELFQLYTDAMNQARFNGAVELPPMAMEATDWTDMHQGIVWGVNPIMRRSLDL